MGKVSAMTNTWFSIGMVIAKNSSRCVSGGDTVEIFDPKDEGLVWPRFGKGSQKEGQW